MEFHKVVARTERLFCFGGGGGLQCTLLLDYIPPIEEGCHHPLTGDIRRDFRRWQGELRLGIPKEMESMGHR